MKFSKEDTDLLEMLIEELINRSRLANVVGKDHPTVQQLDKEIDAITAKMRGEI